MLSTFPSFSRRQSFLAALAVLVFALSAGLLHSVEDRRLTVFVSGKTYSVGVTDSEKFEYAALSEVLQPLGKLTLRAQGRTLHLKLNDVEGEFSENKKLCRVGGTELLLPAKAIVDGGRMMVPLRSIPRLIKQYLGQEAVLHAQGHRLFVGQAGESFTIEIKRPENNLLLTFPAAVTPTITNDGGKVYLSFATDPVIFGADSLAYNDKVITGVSFSEHNGTAEIVVTGTTSLVANLQNGGKVISVSAAPSVAASAAAPAGAEPAVQPPATSATTSASPPPDQAAAAQTPARTPEPGRAAVPFFVMIDASHGGEESGARFSEKLFEKDITLAVARRLRSELHNRGVTAVLLRDSDATMSYDQRAVTTNAQRAAVYVAIHAGLPGRGVRVYTTLLASAAPTDKTRKPNGPFVPWERAQESHLDNSRLLANAIVDEMTSAKIRSASANAPLLPLKSIAAPAVAIEIAPAELDAKPETMTVTRYQQAIVSGVAAAIVNARPKLEARP